MLYSPTLKLSWRSLAQAYAQSFFSPSPPPSSTAIAINTLEN
jgi:hypothetical protein